MESILDEARTWFLDALAYEGRELVIRVVEGVPSDQADELRIRDVVIHGAFRVGPGAQSRTAIVRFDAPVAWEVVDESFTAADPYEERDGRGSLQVLTRSRYLDHVRAAHGWFEEVKGPGKHYRVWTVGEVIEVIAREPPQVEPADDPRRPGRPPTR